MTLSGGEKLSALTTAVEDARITNMRDVVVKDIRSDSRQVEPGDLFVAVRGARSDGHRFVDMALQQGAVAVVTEKAVDVGNATAIVVDDSAKALALLASRFYGDPSRSLRLFGVTGTNGKTSTTHLFRAICDKSSWGKVGLIGTVGHGTATRMETAMHTTPEPITLHRLLKQMKEEACSGVVMEVSSHAVRQQRTWGLDFEIGMLTNVTRDHLDYHASFDDYIDAKREFCYSLISTTRTKQEGTLIYSRDNDISRDIGDAFPGSKVSTSMGGEADVFADNVDATLEKTRFDLHLGEKHTIRVEMKLLGSFSVANALMAAAGAHLLGVDDQAIKAGLEAVDRVPGRFDKLGGDSKPLVIIDYSHTPDSLERTLRFSRGLGPKRLIVVFGCGGDRDRGKRPVMGKIAQQNSDICYVTSDNPRTEDPREIIEEILQGMDPKASGLFVEVDRRHAIEQAITNAQIGDLVAICGKGHEDYQIIGTTRHHFDDREEAERALAQWGSR